MASGYYLFRVSLNERTLPLSFSFRSLFVVEETSYLFCIPCILHLANSLLQVSLSVAPLPSCPRVVSVRAGSLHFCKVWRFNQTTVEVCEKQIYYCLQNCHLRKCSRGLNVPCFSKGTLLSSTSDFSHQTRRSDKCI